MDSKRMCNLLPENLREALKVAAAAKDYEMIDRLTDRLAREHPDLVIPRHVCRPEMANTQAGRITEPPAPRRAPTLGAAHRRIIEQMGQHGVMSDKELASVCGLSANTVHTYMSAVFAALGVKSRREVALWAAANKKAAA